MQHLVAFTPDGKAAATFRDSHYKGSIFLEEAAAALQARHTQAGPEVAIGDTVQLAADNTEFPNAVFRVVQRQLTEAGIQYEIELP